MLRAEQRMGRTGLGFHHRVMILGSSTVQRVLQRIFAYCLTYLECPSASRAAQACTDKS